VTTASAFLARLFRLHIFITPKPNTTGTKGDSRRVVCVLSFFRNI
jgi:hypothetical protein